MNTRKKIFLYGAIFILLSGSFMLLDNLLIKNAEIMADRVILAESFIDLENKSDIIVLATIMPDKENILTTKADGTVTFGYTLTKLDIIKILYRKTDNSNIIITEEYFTTDDIIGKTIWTQDDYQPAKNGSDYVFF